MAKKAREGMLSPYRILDLAGDELALCGKMLADMGAEVIKVEKPGGDPARRRGPFFHDQAATGRSLFWLAYNSNKKSVTLNLDTSDGREVFRRLVEKADIVIESFAPGYLDDLGLGYEILKANNPGLILTSITPFGQTGKYKDFKGSDIVCMAMSGYMYLCGHPDGPPVRISVPQMYCHAAADAASGTMIAHFHRQSGGQGQQVDVPIWSMLIPAMQEAHAWYNMHHLVVKRAGIYRSGLARGSVDKRMRQTWRCKDGWVNLAIYGGPAYSTANRPLVEWMAEEGMADDFLLGLDWTLFDAFSAPQEELNKVMEPVARFLLTHTKSELTQGAVERGVFLCPVNTIADIVNDPQIGAREFWVRLENPEWGETITYPGAFIKASETPLQLRQVAPRAGEHNQQIYGEYLGLSKGEMITLKESGVI